MEPGGVESWLASQTFAGTPSGRLACGAIVGESIVGADVEAYMAFVGAYLSGLER